MASAPRSQQKDAIMTIMRSRAGVVMTALGCVTAIASLGQLGCSPASAPSPGAADPPAAAAAAASSHTITWDRYSLLIDGQRVFVWSGEFHPFRLPSPSLWRDVLQKLKANGYNAVSLYFDWGYHSPAPGVYDFTGVRDMDQVLDLC